VVLIGHIYMGTLGVKGALDAMKTGWVNDGWAQEHHSLWYDDIQAGKIPAQRSGTTPPALSHTPGAAQA
jgi:formate dehydrogenase subunit gamma